MKDQKQAILGGFEEFVVPDARGKLQEKFLIPPFSVLDARQGYWQERKKQWLELGIQSEIGRGMNLLQFSEQAQIKRKNYVAKGLLMQSDSGNDPRYYFKKQELEKKLGREISTEEFQRDYYEGADSYKSGTSIFDPVLCELAYKWFCPENGIILDPFAGGSVRGIVAGMLEYDYHGIDLSSEQLGTNRKQAQDIEPTKMPVWYDGDSSKMNELLPAGLYYDLLFSCPPYHDLEKYGDDIDDLCNMSWGTFKQVYSDIIAKGIMRLKPNRFACFVVSEIRDEVGGYKGLVPFTIESFSRDGARFYNEIILVNTIGSLALRIGTQFGSFRKVGRTHQNVLVFYKGDIQSIPFYHKQIDTGMPEYSE